jgi:dienelactone hydrolase
MTFEHRFVLALLTPLLTPLLTTLFSATSHAQTAVPSLHSTSSTLTVAGMPAKLYPAVQAAANKTDVRTGVVLVGGSEGQLLMADDIGPQLAKAGYTSLGVRYHDGWAGDQKLTQIPIEGFLAAAARLAQEKGIERVVLIGDSRGSEAVMLSGIEASKAAKSPISGVVAYVPTSHVWSGIGGPDWVAIPSWTIGGKALPVVPPFKMEPFKETYFTQAIAKATDAEREAAAIAVEQLRMPLLLLAADDDKVWPSGDLTRLILDRLKGKKASAPVLSVIYPNCGHRLVGTGPSAPSETYKYSGGTWTSHYGGTAEGNLAARTDAWRQLLGFLAAINAGQTPRVLPVQPIQ